MEKIDLHTHSILSDGTDTFFQLVEQAKKEGITYLSVTDHNTIEGSYEAKCYTSDEISILPGAEFTARCQSGKLHLTCYCFDYRNRHLNEMVEQVRHLRLVRMQDYFDGLESTFHLHFPQELYYKTINRKGDIGKGYFADLCVEAGFSKDREEAFRTYIHPLARKINSNHYKLDPEEVINSIHRAGGLVSLAHFHTLSKSGEELTRYIGRLKHCGLDAIEVRHSSFDEKRRYTVKRLAEKFHLLESVGTDYHGKNKPQILLGHGKGDNCLSEQCSMIDSLIARGKVKKIEKHI